MSIGSLDPNAFKTAQDSVRSMPSWPEALGVTAVSILVLA